MPKEKIKQYEYMTDTGLVLDAEQSAMVRKQVYEGSYSLGAPKVTTSDETITVEIKTTVYTGRR